MSCFYSADAEILAETWINRIHTVNSEWSLYQSTWLESVGGSHATH